MVGLTSQLLADTRSAVEQAVRLELPPADWVMVESSIGAVEAALDKDDPEQLTGSLSELNAFVGRDPIAEFPAAFPGLPHLSGLSHARFDEAAWPPVNYGSSGTPGLPVLAKRRSGSLSLTAAMLLIVVVILTFIGGPHIATSVWRTAAGVWSAIWGIRILGMSIGVMALAIVFFAGGAFLVFRAWTMVKSPTPRVGRSAADPPPLPEFPRPPTHLGRMPVPATKALHDQVARMFAAIDARDGAH
ncbi:MAG: hypothetical protein WCE30_05275 [Mycobacterium sp.]